MVHVGGAHIFLCGACTHAMNALDTTEREHRIYEEERRLTVSDSPVWERTTVTSSNIFICLFYVQEFVWIAQ